MSQHEIIALRCPSCGSGITEPSRDRPFGAEFRCDGCGITSVLIVDQALVPLSTLQKQGEKVCVECGRMVLREARFCQEGHALVRLCNHPGCNREFPVDHQRCDFCGRLQEREVIEIASLRGVFYRAKPGFPPLAEVGTVVKANQVIYVIKWDGWKEGFTDCQSGHSGEVVAFHVNDGQRVDYGDTLLTIKLE